MLRDAYCENQVEKTKPIYSYCVLRDAYCENQVEKTKPIYSYCVMRDAFCGKECEKTKPIPESLNGRKMLLCKDLGGISHPRAVENKANSKHVLSAVEWANSGPILTGICRRLAA
ncbi:MAG: hypothetical protein CEE38_09370 [Planctomycetes bacterium B3_Pla]|nr:MAG: hypothetical protein CEE38_09370 [Planctomycetes bacterium B3_Pla]